MDEQEALERRREVSQVLRTHCNRFSRMGLALAAVVGAQYVVQLCALLLIWAAPALYTPLFLGIVGLISSYGVGFALFVRIIRTVPKSEPGQTVPLRPGLFVQVYFISLAGIYLFNIATQLLLTAIGALTGGPMQNPVDSMESFPFLFNLIQGCVVAPVCEELMFRKLLLDRLRPYGGGFAVVASALAFGLLHGNLAQLFYAFALGCVFGYVALWTGRIRETILLHALVNAISVVLILLLDRFGDTAVSVFGLFVLGAIVLGIYFFHHRRRELQFYPNVFGLQKGQPWRLLFGSPGFLLFTVICVGECVLLFFL